MSRALAFLNSVVFTRHMNAPTDTDRTYHVLTSLPGSGKVVTHEVEAPNARMAQHFGESMAAAAGKVSASAVHVVDVRLKPRPDLACATCNELEGSDYRGDCCDPDNMIEV